MIKKIFLTIAIFALGIAAWGAFNPPKVYAQCPGVPWVKYCCTAGASCNPAVNCAGAPQCVWGWQDCNGNGVPDAGDYWDRLETCSCDCSGSSCSAPAWQYYCEGPAKCYGDPACVWRQRQCAPGSGWEGTGWFWEYQYGCKEPTACCSGASCVSCAAPATPTPTPPPADPTGWINCNPPVVYFDSNACINGDDVEISWGTSNAGRVCVLAGEGVWRCTPEGRDFAGAGWVCTGTSLVFTLYADYEGENQISLDSCSVTGRYTPGTSCGNNYRCVDDPSCLPAPTPTSTPEPGKAHLAFKVKFQGITQQRPDKTVRVILKQGDQEKYSFASIGVSSDQNGVYSATVAGIDPGTYDVFIKGWAHLQKEFAGINLAEGDNTQDWSGTVLVAGDINGDNRINAVDIGIVIDDYWPNTPAGSPADFNLDEKVNAVDIGLVIENYFLEGD